MKTPVVGSPVLVVLTVVMDDLAVLKAPVVMNTLAVLKGPLVVKSVPRSVALMHSDMVSTPVQMYTNLMLII